jgi:RNA chaperone Hfq
MQPRTSAGRDFQENVLGHLMERRQITTIYLRNRMSLRGRILTFDPYVLLLEPLDGSPPQLVYKSAIVSITGPRQVRRDGPPRGPGGPRPGGPPFRPREGERSYGERSYGERSYGERSYGERSYPERPYPERGYPERPYPERGAPERSVPGREAPEAGPPRPDTGSPGEGPPGSQEQSDASGEA